MNHRWACSNRPQLQLHTQCKHTHISPQSYSCHHTASCYASLHLLRGILPHAQCRAGLAMLLTRGLPTHTPLLINPGPVPEVRSLRREAGRGDPAAPPASPAAPAVPLTTAAPPTLPLLRPGLGLTGYTGLLARRDALMLLPLPGEAAAAAGRPLPLLLGSKLGATGPPQSWAVLLLVLGAAAVGALRAWPSSTCAALDAKLSELTVSPHEAASGDRLHTSSTLLLPHKLSCRTCMQCTPSRSRGSNAVPGENFFSSAAVDQPDSRHEWCDELDCYAHTNPRLDLDPF